jgi:hypothetical protein
MLNKAEKLEKGMDLADSFYVQTKVIKDVRGDFAGEKYRLKLETELAKLDLDSTAYNEVLATFDKLVKPLK